MATAIDEQIASYIYDANVKYGVYNIIARYSSVEDYNDRKVDSYHIYDNSGYCVSENEHIYDMPSWNDVFQCYWIPSITESEKEHTRDLKFLSKGDSCGKN